jgi:predicted ATPase
MAEGAYEQVERYATRQVALEPWHEEGHRQLMQALAFQGRQSAALRQYESCRRILQQEWGVPPSPETTRLYEQIRTGKFDKVTRDPKGRPGDKVIQSPSHPITQSPNHLVTPSPLHNLPTTLAPLVGRSQQLEQLRSLVGNATQRLLTIVGMGGMGKSRLALALLEQLVAESPAPRGYPHPGPFANGVWFVPVVGVTPSAGDLPDALAGATLKVLQILTPNQEALRSALFHYLAQRQLLLVFDSFEHLLLEEQSATAATKFILALLQAAPGAILVVTSRLPLQLLAETVIRLEGLPVPPGLAPRVDRRDAANYESVRLFVYHAQRTLPDFTLSDDNLPAVIDLCRALSGMPLAIELAAALTPHFTPSELVVAIRQNLELLVSRRRDLDARHRHFSAVLESSWQLLSAHEQKILAQSSIFVGRFSRAAAQAVTGATVSELTSLVDKSLIQQSGVGVYQLHDLLRKFAADKLHIAEEETSAVADVLRTVADRHSAFYLNFVAAREQMLTRQQPRQAVEEIQAEVDNVRQAWVWAVTRIVQVPRETALYARLDASAYGLWHFYLIAGLYTEGIATFRQASAGVQAALTALGALTTEDARLTQRPMLSRRRKTANETFSGQGLPTFSDSDKTMNTGEKSGAEAVIRHWQQLLSKLLALEAYMLGSHGNYTEAPAIAKQAIAVGVAYGGNAGEIIGLLAIAQAHYHNGAPEEAKAYAGQALQRLHQLQWPDEPPEFYYDIQFMAYLYLGVIAINADDYEQARTYMTQALQLCQPLGKVRGEMHARLNLANLARYRQNYEAARQDYQQVLQIACELGYRRGEAMARYELADVLRGLGEYPAALDQFALALVILREIGEPFHENYAQVDVGRLHAFMGDYARAQALVHQALMRSEHFTMLDAKLDTWLAAALLHQLAGEESEALPYATRCHQVACERGSRRYEGYALLYMGNALAGLGRWSEANAAYADALQLYQLLDIQPLVAEAQAGLARVALMQGDRTAALTWVEKILAILAASPTIGLDEPFQIYLTCCHTLTANADPRAMVVLERGAKELFRYAEQITDSELRRSFLERVPTHHALQQLYIATVGTVSAPHVCSTQ